MGKFQKFVPERVDREAQKKKKLSDIEMLILKPHTEGLEKLTREEINQYIGLDVEELKKTNMNIKTILIAQETQKFLIEHKEEILKRIILNGLKCSKYSERGKEDEYAKEV